MPYDIAGALQNPNIIQNALAAGQAGRMAGLQDQAVQKQNALARLSSQAYSTPTEGRNGLLQQMAAIDPDSANKQAQAFASMDDQKKAQVAAGLDQFAHTAASIAQDPDEQRATAAYGALIDHLASTGKDVSQFRNVPPKVGAQMALVQIASIKDLLAASGIGADVGTVVAPGGALVNKATGAPMFRNPAALQYHDVPMGEGRAAGAFDPATGAVRPAVGGAPAAQAPSDPMPAILAQANQMSQSGTPQAQVEQWIAQQAQAAGVQMTPEGGNQLQTTQPVMPAQPPAQFGIGTPKPSAEDQESFGAPQQVIGADGKPHLVQFGNRGGMREVPGMLKPEMTAAQAAKQALQQSKAEQTKADTVQSYNDSINAIDQVLTSPGAGMLGTFTGDVLGKIPHTDTADAEKKLDVIKNQVLLNTISKLKALSATGASGFGQLSNQEGEILKNSIANLTTAQSNKQLIESLNTIKSTLQRSRDNIVGAQVAFPNGSQSQQPAAPATGGWSATRVQ